jgi:hypothetical protein
MPNHHVLQNMLQIWLYDSMVVSRKCEFEDVEASPVITITVVTILCPPVILHVTSVSLQTKRLGITRFLCYNWDGAVQTLCLVSIIA